MFAFIIFPGYLRTAFSFSTSWRILSWSAIKFIVTEAENQYTVCLNTEIDIQANCKISSTIFQAILVLPIAFRHFIKCLTSRIACNIYAYIDTLSTVVFIASYSSIFKSFRVYCRGIYGIRLVDMYTNGGGGGVAIPRVCNASLAMQIIMLGD